MSTQPANLRTERPHKFRSWAILVVTNVLSLVCMTWVLKNAGLHRIYEVKTLDERLDEVLARPRFYAGATALLSLMTALLAMVGIYGTTSYAVEQRRPEMGIRTAVGATAWRLRGMMIGEARGRCWPGLWGERDWRFSWGGFWRHCWPPWQGRIYGPVLQAGLSCCWQE